MQHSSAYRRYRIAVGILSVLYVAFLFGAEMLMKHHAVSGALAYGAAILPALPIIGIFFAIARYLVEEQDEYIRMLMIRKSLAATGFMLSVATVWGFLESFQLVSHVDAYFSVVLWFGGLGLAGCTDKLLRKGAA